MEKMLNKTNSVINENEKVIANILHDVKSPLYSIKIALQNKLDTELNRDVYETAIEIIKYIENFLVNYSFKQGRFETKITTCDIKKIINKKIESLKYIFINKNIRIDMIMDDGDFVVESIEIFLASIIGNIISNIAFHASQDRNAVIEMYKKDNNVIVEFRNAYNDRTDNFNLGLNFCKELTNATKASLKFSKTKDMVFVKLKVPTLKKLNR